MNIYAKLFRTGAQSFSLITVSNYYWGDNRKSTWYNASYLKHQISFLPPPVIKLQHMKCISERGGQSMGLFIRITSGAFYIYIHTHKCTHTHHKSTKLETVSSGYGSMYSLTNFSIRFCYIQRTHAQTHTHSYFTQPISTQIQFWWSYCTPVMNGIQRTEICI